MILLLDTSTSHLAIGIADDEGTLLSEFHADASETERGIHDARLASETARLLAKQGVATNSISKIGLIIGPGSFTGLRIGLSFAKGIAFANDAALVPLTQHEVMAETANGTGEYLLTPGYQPELYYFATEVEPKNIRLMKRAELWELAERPTIAHDLFQLHPDRLPWKCSYVAPSLSAMARLTANAAHPLSGTDLDSLEPLYITEFKPG